MVRDYFWPQGADFKFPTLGDFTELKFLDFEELQSLMLQVLAFPPPKKNSYSSLPTLSYPTEPQVLDPSKHLCAKCWCISSE